MYCKKCGKEITDGSLYCGYCGEPTDQSLVGSVKISNRKSIQIDAAIAIVILLIIVLWFTYKLGRNKRPIDPFLGADIDASDEYELDVDEDDEKKILSEPIKEYPVDDIFTPLLSTDTDVVKLKP